MKSSEQWIVALCVGVLIIAAGMIGHRVTGMNQDTSDITAEYAIPPDLAGCRVHRMIPRGFGQTIYVISRDGEPVAAEWDEWHGKTIKRNGAVMP